MGWQEDSYRLASSYHFAAAVLVSVYQHRALHALDEFTFQGSDREKGLDLLLSSIEAGVALRNSDVLFIIV